MNRIGRIEMASLTFSGIIFLRVWLLLLLAKVIEEK
jgi:hypothetical protein